MKQFLSFSIIITLLVSCGQNTNNQLNNKGDIVTGTATEQAEFKIEKMISETELNDKLVVMNSLYFTKSDLSSIEVFAYLDKQNNILKIEEKFVDVAKNQSSTNTYYIHKNKKYATKERYSSGKAKNSKYTERVSFYDNNEKVILSKSRSTIFEEDLEANNFINIPFYDCPITRAMNVINQVGEFETKFQGFVINGPDSYLLVGESGDNGYVSSLMIQFHTALTKKLLNNQEKFLGTKLKVEYQKMTEGSGFEYQILLSSGEIK